MSKLQEQVEIARRAISDYSVMKYCGQQHYRQEYCENCPAKSGAYGCAGKEKLQSWLHTNGFPVSRPHVHTAAELAKQLIKGRGLPCLTQWVTQNVEAVTCPECGEHTLNRERRMECKRCASIYPADKWAAGEPCDCGSFDAKYYGVHTANSLGQLEFQRCQTPGCRWAGDYRRLTVHELAGAAQAAADEQWAEARTCQACGDASGSDQRDGIYLPIENCECGWAK